MDIKVIKELARVMRENDLTALEVKEGEEAIKLERKQNAGTPAVSLPDTPSLHASPAAQEENASAASQRGSLVLSPTVGVFYTAPSPEAKPFVEVGDRVKKGDVLCIIEAMKLMNEIPAETEGVITEICVNNGQVVEYNQPLFRIE